MSPTRALRTACMLLLISQVTCDWVEIEQDHYTPRRKSTINSNLRNPNEEFQLEETTKLDKEQNEDIKWSKGYVDRVTNVAKIRRVQTPSVKTTGVKLDHAGNVIRKNTPNTDEAEGASTKQYHDHTNSPHRHYFTERPSGVNLRISQTNKGTPVIQSLDHLKNTPNNFERNKDKEISIDNNKLNRNKIYQIQTFKEHPANDNTNAVQNESIENDYNDHFQIIQNGRTKTSPKPNIFHTQAFTTKRLKIFHRKHSTEEHTTPNSNYRIGSFKYPNSSITKPSTQSRITKIDIVSEKPTNIKILHSNTPNILQNEAILQKKDDDKELPIKEQSKPIEETSDNKNENKMDGMLKLMKVVSDIIYKNTHRSFKGKVMYLEGLKITLLSTIEDHINKLWPDDADRSRQVREARGHLEFPSSESALMTISFLTFAVFLIKLVLQVIHTYKNKTMMVTPTVVTAVGRLARALRSEH